jgi:hypothetical protein
MTKTQKPQTSERRSNVRTTVDPLDGNRPITLFPTGKSV